MGTWTRIARHEYDKHAS
ncbi:hypothetical protein SELA5_p0038 (plasmid) [Salmonella enterica subsp. enterica serovar Enteritidis str. LA5]|nr:hypothetical protein SELA5_p0038 [Salmonella enterica subsp. enterica serovar Enteritidis str. LA5]